MGNGVNVSCACFGSFMLLVGSRIASPPYCLFPFVCSNCHKASCLDIHAKSLACEHCGSTAVSPYGGSPAVGEAGHKVVFACGPSAKFCPDQLTLTDGTYWCPTCRKYTARLSDSGLQWD